MKKKIIKFKLGDVVQLNKFWNNRIGIVKADNKSWWVINGHYDIANCICEAKDVIKIIKKSVIPKNLLKYVNR